MELGGAVRPHRIKGSLPVLCFWLLGCGHSLRASSSSCFILCRLPCYRLANTVGPFSRVSRIVRPSLVVLMWFKWFAGGSSRSSRSEVVRVVRAQKITQRNERPNTDGRPETNRNRNGHKQNKPDRITAGLSCFPYTEGGRLFALHTL